MSPTRQAEQTYHHGDLENALIAAGLEIVESEGVAALSLRAVARRAKVSHAAPYHHFAGKADLLAAVAAAGFGLMVQAIRRRAAQKPPRDPLDPLRAVGLGYVAFALGHPSVFRLMFRPELTRPAKHPRLREAEAQAFGALNAAIVLAQQAGKISGADPRAPAAFAWSTVHGLAMLHLDEVFAETALCTFAFKRLNTLVQDAIIAGLQAHVWP